ncbi:MAG: PAS domain-containing sensor histidine kinase [Gammaproteobacteria bacterium]
MSTEDLTTDPDMHQSDSDEPSFAWRIVNLLSIYRVLTCIVLLILYLLISNPPVVGTHDQHLFLLTIIVYLIFSVLGWAGMRQGKPRAVAQLQWMLLVDIFAISLLLHASGGIQSGLGNLLIVSVGATAMALPRKGALVFAAMGAIAILLEQLVSQYEGITELADFTPAGALGATIFLIAVAAYPLARRLRESEQLAAQRGLDLANLNELNRYIIRHLRESIVVIDEEDSVRLINESAASLLGVPYASSGRPLEELSPELHRLTLAWRESVPGVAAAYGSMRAADGSTVLTPHFAPIGEQSPSPTNIFLENTSELSERVQQSKLAALGRLSASIAHEIRNPVGAISHASQLLSEAPGIAKEDKRLTDIIDSHCHRVSDIIDSVLRFSRRDHTRPQKIELNGWLTEFIADYEPQAAGTPINFEQSAGALQVRVDPGHLQQVMWNLCENASRYGRGPSDEGFTIASGRLHGNQRPYLEVKDRGPGISEDKVEHVFEPFFTNAADGTGLGLFIARELCECNRATLGYEPRAKGGSRFRIVFSDPERWVT